MAANTARRLSKHRARHGKARGSPLSDVGLGPCIYLLRCAQFIHCPELDRTISIPLDLDEVADDGGAVFELAGFGDVVPEGLHVPGGGGAAFGAEAAVEADVLVLDHDAAGLEAALDVEVGWVRLSAGTFVRAAKVGLVAVGGEGDARSSGRCPRTRRTRCIWGVKDGLDVAVEAALRPPCNRRADRSLSRPPACG